MKIFMGIHIWHAQGTDQMQEPWVCPQKHPWPSGSVPLKQIIEEPFVQYFWNHYCITLTRERERGIYRLRRSILQCLHISVPLQSVEPARHKDIKTTWLKKRVSQTTVTKIWSTERRDNGYKSNLVVEKPAGTRCYDVAAVSSSYTESFAICSNTSSLSLGLTGTCERISIVWVTPSTFRERWKIWSWWYFSDT